MMPICNFADLLMWLLILIGLTIAGFLFHRLNITMPNQSTADRFPTAITGNIGLFHVCRELSRRRLNVVPTSRNTKAADILVGDADSSKYCTVQVKTSGTGISIQLSETKKIQDKDAIAKCKEKAEAKCRSADFWVFVRVHKNKNTAIKDAPISAWICRGDDIHLIGEQKTEKAFRCWFDVWNTNGVEQKIIDEWTSRENRWDLIEDYLRNS